MAYIPWEAFCCHQGCRKSRRCQRLFPFRTGLCPFPSVLLHCPPGTEAFQTYYKVFLVEGKVSFPGFRLTTCSLSHLKVIELPILFIYKYLENFLRIGPNILGVCVHSQLERNCLGLPTVVAFNCQLDTT